MSTVKVKEVKKIKYYVLTSSLEIKVKKPDKVSYYGPFDSIEEANIKIDTCLISRARLRLWLTIL